MAVAVREQLLDTNLITTKQTDTDAAAIMIMMLDILEPTELPIDLCAANTSGTPVEKLAVKEAG